MPRRRRPSRVEKADIKVARAAGPVRHHPLTRIAGDLSEVGDQPPLRAIAAATIAAGAVGRDRRLTLAGMRMLAAHQMATSVFHNLVRLMDGRPLRRFDYHDHGSLVSISRFSTVGSLMGNLIGGRMAIEGRIARFVYVSLYRMHLIAIHGWLRGMGLIVIGRVNTIIRPRLKLH